MHDEEQDERLYDVVVSDEEQYSIWLCGMVLPPGWRIGGMTGTKSACLAHIAEVWTDMRPLTVRRSMEASGPGERSSVAPKTVA